MYHVSCIKRAHHTILRKFFSSSGMSHTEGSLFRPIENAILTAKPSWPVLLKGSVDGLPPTLNSMAAMVWILGQSRSSENNASFAKFQMNLWSGRRSFERTGLVFQKVRVDAYEQHNRAGETWLSDSGLERFWRNVVGSRIGKHGWISVTNLCQ